MAVGRRIVWSNMRRKSSCPHRPDNTSCVHDRCDAEPFGQSHVVNQPQHTTHNMFPTAPTTPYMQRPPIPGGPLVPHIAGSPGYSGMTPRFTHSPYTPHQPLLEVHLQPAYPAYYLREPCYGLPPPPPPP